MTSDEGAEIEVSGSTNLMFSEEVGSDGTMLGAKLNGELHVKGRGCKAGGSIMSEPILVRLRLDVNLDKIGPAVVLNGTIFGVIGTGGDCSKNLTSFEIITLF